MCFSMAWLLQTLIWLIIIGAVVAIFRLLLPFVLGWFGTAGTVIMAAINILIWAIVAIAAITFIFQLISCLFSLGGGMPHLGVR